MTRYDVEIDFCPRCRGVWLDRGELDKIIAHSVKHHEAEEQENIQKVLASQPPQKGERRHIYPPRDVCQRFRLEQYFDF